MKLHLGCGMNYLDGWVNIDVMDNAKVDIHSQIEDLDYPDNSIDEILLMAVFEHFPRHVAIMQLRKFYKWLKNKGIINVLVPDFWGTIKKMQESKSVREQQFWYRHIFGPQDTAQFGTHYDGFDVNKMLWMFQIVGFNEGKYMMFEQWPNISFRGIKDKKIKSDADAERDIIEYMAAYEAKIEGGTLFKAWMDAMGLKAEKPDTPTFKTQYVEGKSE